MRYGEMVPALFLERPNRFIAYCEVGGHKEKVHVKNTGRCKELLVPGCRVYLERAKQSGRKTNYSLISVEKGELLINMDSQAPNVVVGEALRLGQIQLPGICGTITLIKREQTYGHSRFDFYLETSQSEKIFIEVKGVTLEEEGIVRFPDAPTERGVKHVEELIGATQEGYKCFMIFVIQMESAQYFTPHKERHLAFAEAVQQAKKAGVGILAYTCQVTQDTLEIKQAIPVCLDL